MELAFSPRLSQGSDIPLLLASKQNISLFSMNVYTSLVSPLILVFVVVLKGRRNSFLFEAAAKLACCDCVFGLRRPPEAGLGWPFRPRSDISWVVTLGLAARSSDMKAALEIFYQSFFSPKCQAWKSCCIARSSSSKHLSENCAIFGGASHTMIGVP